MPENSHPVDLTDVTSLTELLGYAATAQVTWLSERASPRLTQNAIARRLYGSEGRRAGTAGAGASSTLSRSLRAPKVEFLQRLDEVILTAAPELSSAGGLAALAARLVNTRHADNIEATISPIYRSRLLMEDEPKHQVIILLQASVLLSTLEKAQVRSDADREFDGALARVVDRDTLMRVVDRLILIGGLSPTPYSVDALMLLGGISRYAFGLVRERLHMGLRTPLGFRAWRALTAIVKATVQLGAENTPEGRVLRDFVRAQLAVCDKLREQSIYPARSLDLELAIEVPLSWTPDWKTDWANEVLWRRAQNGMATLRERATAAFGLWERLDRTRLAENEAGELIRHPVDDGRKQELLTLIEQFIEESPKRPGLRWVAETLRQNIEEDKPILTHWRPGTDPCQGVIDRAAQRLREALPPRISEATVTLFEHALIKNAGVYRRRAIDTIRASGWATDVVPALGAVLDDPDAEPWLRCRTLFAIGYLQIRSDAAQAILIESCRRACIALEEVGIDDTPESRVAVLELHAALFAVGDAFGDPDGEMQAHQLRESLDDDVLEVLVEKVMPGEVDGPRPEADKPAMDAVRSALVPVARALAYVLAMTAHVNPIRSKRLLSRLTEHPDPATRSLSGWGVDRFSGRTTPRPAHDSPIAPINLDR